MHTALEHATAHGADAATVAAFASLSEQDASGLRRDLEKALRAMGRGAAADALSAAPLPRSARDVAALMGVAKCFEGIATDELKAAVSIRHMLARASDDAAALWSVARAPHEGPNGELGNSHWLKQIAAFDTALQRAGVCPEETARGLIGAIRPAISALGRNPYADGAAELDRAGRILGPLLNVIELRLAEANLGPRHAIDSYHGASPQITFQHLQRGDVQAADGTDFFIQRNKRNAQQWEAQSPLHRDYVALVNHLESTLQTAVNQAPR